MDLRTAARLLGGDVSAGQVSCLGPGHRPKDRSLAVKFSPGSPDGFIIWSFADDNINECRDHVRERLGLGAFKGRDLPEQPRRPAAARLKPVPVPNPSDDADRTARALNIWRAAD